MSPAPSSPTLSSRRALLVSVLVAVAVAAYLCLVVRYLDRPLRFDEVEWPVQAGGILHHGAPKVLYSEDKTLWLEPLKGYDAHYGMWHPPTYQYSLAAGMAVFGRSDALLRGVSLLWFVACLALGWRVLGLLLPRDTPPALRAVPIALMLLAPLVGEGSLHLDIDNTSLTFCLLLFSYAFLRDPFGDSWRRCFGLGALLTLALWSKLTTPFLVLGAAVLFLLLSRRLRAAVRVGAVTFVVGLGLFAATYLLFCKLLHYPPRFMFDYSYLHNRKIYQPNDLWPIVQSLRWHVVWLSPAIGLLYLACLGARLRGYFAGPRGEWRTEPADFLLLASAATFFFYVPWGGVFGKYTVPAAILGLLGTAPALVGAIREARIERPRLYLGLCLALAGAHALFLPALQLRPPRAAAPSLPWLQSILDPRNLLLLFALGSLVAFHLLARRFTASRLPILLSLMVYAALANPVNALKVILPDYDRSPYRPFFDRGFRSTVAALDRDYPDGAVLLCPKDIGYYFHGRHYVLETIGAVQGTGAYRPLIDGGTVAAVVDDLKYPTLTDPELLRYLDATASRSQVEDFVIWRLRPKGS